MDCSTVSCSDCGDEGVLLSAKMVKAGKKCRCEECHINIEKGTEYYREVLVFEENEKPKILRTCPTCLNIRNTFFEYGFIYSTVLDDLNEHIYQCDGDISEGTLAKLTPEAKEVVCEMLEEYFEEHSDSDESDED